MAEQFTVKLEPFEIQETVGNLTVTKSLNQDRVIIVTADGQQCWGYVSTIPEHGTFLPLSGFPKELVGEVQRQINELRGFASEEGPKPPEVLESGRTAAEQLADGSETELDEEEEYE